MARKAIKKGVQVLQEAVGNLYQLGDAGDDALRAISKNLNTDDAVKAMNNASEEITRMHPYNNAKGTKEIIDIPTSTRSTSNNLPATIDQLQQSNKEFTDMMGQAAYNSSAPHTNKGPNYNGAKGHKDYTDTWEASKKRSWEQRANTTEVSRGREEIVPYVDPETRQSEHINRMADAHLERRKLDEANRTKWERIKNKVSDIFTGSDFNRKTTANRQAYNEFLHNQGNNSYVKTNREFERMQSSMGIHGTYTGTAEGFDALNRAQRRIETEAAAKAAENASEGMDWSGISEWAHDNQLIVAGAIAGTAIVGSSLLNDDDYQ